MKDTDFYIMKIPFWEKLSEKEKTDLRRSLTVRKYDKGSILYESRENCLGILYVIKGCVRVYINSEDGREITLFRISELEDCVLSSSCVIHQLDFDTVMSAESETERFILDAHSVQEIAEKNVNVKSYIYEKITERFSQAMWVMQEIVFKRFDQRLAGFLLEEYEKTDNPVIKMTQEEVAQMVNSAREVVARMLSRFSSEGIIESKRGMITILDIDGLKKLI